ncbi:hypothetical protein Tco_0564255 [Tanacetum coccineum]
MTEPNTTKQPIDKAYSIASIKACIPTPLDLGALNYNSWSSLFKRFCKTYKVHHHLKAPSTTSTSTIRNMAIGNLSVNDYFQELKSKVDRLTNLGSKVSDESLVTYGINGACRKFPEVARIIRHREKLPTFDEARSMILLEERDWLTQQ